MNESFAIIIDEVDGTVLITGWMPSSCQAQLADALARAARKGSCRLDLTGLDGLPAAALEVLLVLAREVDLELVVRSEGPIAHAVQALGPDRLAVVHEVFTVRAARRQPSTRAWLSA
jgi:hypothetical protein